ncbi:MAG: hypothetical protein A2251_05290 [Elusimicrobia bacterium RIFOXYA2_FULL_47_53]|nr:MAG: hypothetical protein A2278_01840 [Elusimicrobia bacterium RIFOXYA12_FULL_49_49]OGS16909.1 MAG: hypothetical protein A2251_05290 [Elusimicrobia bacterium RIFOXYA2_FULL_47_53]OGS32137.1 MAG: hypothetical protein A2323_08065 [Elusimicrobia bacterium RIFOXYB2_FULL_46_23]
MSVKGKVAVVSGGLGLIGLEIAKVLADNGAKVYIADILRSAKLKYSGIKLVTMDITDENSINSALNTVIKKAGKIDIFINSAYPRTGDWGVKLEDIPFESWKSNSNGHMGGYFLSSRAAAEKMKKRGGTIINLASIYGVVAPDFSVYSGTDMTMPAAYSAIKAGIIGFTKYMAAYFAKYNIRANVVSPGGIFNNQHKTFVRNYCAKTPLGRMGKPADIASAVLFLSSDASSYITGQNLIIDGGWTAV